MKVRETAEEKLSLLTPVLKGFCTDKGFDITSGMIDHLGHERTPETAAAFFAMTCGAEPKTPPTQLAMRITKNNSAGRKTIATNDVNAIADDRVASARPPRREPVVARRDTRPPTRQPAPRPSSADSGRTLASSTPDTSNPVPPNWGTGRTNDTRRSSERPSFRCW